MHLNRETLKMAASEREKAHAHHASSRPLSEGYEFLGLVGEDEFAHDFEEFGFQVDLKLRTSGDGGLDFDSVLGTIDVKTARRAFNLLVEQSKVESDLYVLAQYHEETETATLLGWAYKEEVLNAPIKNFSPKKPVMSRYIPVRKLRSMDSLKALLRQSVEASKTEVASAKNEFVTLGFE